MDGEFIDVKSRVVNNIPIPYLELKPNSDSLLPIKSITVGSKVDYPMSLLALNKFQIYNKLYDIDVYQSNLPI